MKIIAIIGATASGKSQLALDVAKKNNACILSLDSLSVYKHIDICSAKPSLSEREEVRHFGIDVVEPSEKFSVMHFFAEFEMAKEQAIESGQNLIIAGGSSFYLKSMIDGISKLPTITEEISQMASEQMQEREEVYAKLSKLDSAYMKPIDINDTYRITRALEIHLSTKQTPSEYFASHEKLKIIDSIPIYNLLVDRELLRERIAKRTVQMVKLGLVSEIESLYTKYGDNLVPKKAIGIKEVLEYLEGNCTKEQMEELVMSNTRKLAKRQRVFNKTQFSDICIGTYKELYETLCS